MKGSNRRRYFTEAELGKLIGKSDDWCCHHAWNQKPQIHSSTAFAASLLAARSGACLRSALRLLRVVVAVVVGARCARILVGASRDELRCPHGGEFPLRQLVSN